MERDDPARQRRTARIAGLFYLMTFVTGSLALAGSRAAVAANLLATASYVGVTLLFYRLFAPVSRSLSLLAAIVSAIGCLVGFLEALHLAPFGMNALPIFGVYCLLIGWLIVRSGFVPPAFGALMMVGGLGWLTFCSAPLAHALAPFNFAPGILGEGALTVWLLVFGVRPTPPDPRADTRTPIRHPAR